MDRNVFDWRESKPNPKRPRSMGISATSFHNKANLIQSNILQTTLTKAKTREKIKTLKSRLEKYKEITTYEEFPIQEPALQRLQELERDFDEKYNHQGNMLEDEILWSMKPRIFALELSPKGKRKYIVCNCGRFFSHYWMDIDASARHYYELIREDEPCRLYFDLEYNRDANPEIDEETNVQLMDEFLSELFREVKRCFNITIGRSNVIELCSSTEKKFSRHLIVHFPNNELFSCIKSCGSFVKHFVSILADNTELHRTKPALAKHLLVKSKVSNDDDDRKNITCFVDIGVYTKNRLFRLLGSSKYGKPASVALRIARENQYPFPEGFSNSCFYLPDMMKALDARKSDASTSHSSSSNDIDRQIAWANHAVALADTFVVPLKKSTSSKLLCYEGAHTPDGLKTSALASFRPRKQVTKYQNNVGVSPFPLIDDFINKNVASRKGIPGSIRAWMLQNDYSSREIIYQIKDNRWCENINREHKSNNIMWHVSLVNFTYWQTCWDPGKIDI
jgi:hypothetical protein